MVPHFPLPLRRAPHWRLWAGLVLLAMLARAFVATGYMPTFDALRTGKLEITFCTAGGGMQTVALSMLEDGPDHADGSDAAALADCPFGILAAQAILPDLPAVLPLRALVRAQDPVVVQHARPPLPAHGPPLGSRAPPLHLG